MSEQGLRWKMFFAVFAMAMTASASEPSHWVSLGVFGTQDAAERARTQLHPIDDRTTPRVLSIEHGGRSLYRVVAGPYEGATELQRALRSWRGQVRGAFAVVADAATAVASHAPEAAAVTAVAADASNSNPAASPVSVPEAAAAAKRAPADPLPDLRMDSATERLLHDDAALQRELARLSRGLPASLAAELEAAQAQSASLRGISARVSEGPQSPVTAPPDYQLHRLHRDAVPAPSEHDDDDD